MRIPLPEEPEERDPVERARAGFLRWWTAAYIAAGAAVASACVGVISESLAFVVFLYVFGGAALAAHVAAWVYSYRWSDALGMDSGGRKLAVLLSVFNLVVGFLYLVIADYLGFKDRTRGQRNQR